MPPGNEPVLLAELRIEQSRARLPTDHPFVQAPDPARFECFGQEVRVERLGRWGDVRTLYCVAPTLDHIAVAHDTAMPSDEVAELIQPALVQAGLEGELLVELAGMMRSYGAIVWPGCSAALSANALP